jgi:hypothetical protein
MDGEILGSTWSPVNVTPSASSSNTRCPLVWPAVRRASIGRPATDTGPSSVHVSGNSQSAASQGSASASTREASAIRGARPTELVERVRRHAGPQFAELGQPGALATSQVNAAPDLTAQFRPHRVVVAVDVRHVDVRHLGQADVDRPQSVAQDLEVSRDVPPRVDERDTIRTLDHVDVDRTQSVLRHRERGPVDTLGHRVAPGLRPVRSRGGHESETMTCSSPITMMARPPMAPTCSAAFAHSGLSSIAS